MDCDLEQGGRRWAVIEVGMDYDHIESVKCVASFSTEEEAQGHAQALYDKASKHREARMRYADEYLNNLKSSCRSNEDWKRVLVERFGPHVKDPWRGYDMDATGYSIHHQILNIRSSKLDDFHPPQSFKTGDLFVIEVPPCG